MAFSLEAAEAVSRMRLSKALEPRRDEFARCAAEAWEILAGFACDFGWEEYLEDFCSEGIEIFETQAALWRRILDVHGLSPDRPLPTAGLAGALEKRILMALTPEEYARVNAEYAGVEGAWVRLMAHEMAHRLHGAILKGDEEAMGPVWFFEGFAVVASGDLLSGPLPMEDVWSAMEAQGPGAYRRYAAALRTLMQRIPLPEMVRNAARPDFIEWLRRRASA